MKLISVAAAVELSAGFAIAVSPSPIARLVLNSDLNGAGQAVGRLGGFGLMSLGVACWPRSPHERVKDAELQGLITYNVLASVLFIYLGRREALVGPLLWPAAALHTALAILLVRLLVLGRR